MCYTHRRILRRCAAACLSLLVAAALIAGVSVPASAVEAEIKASVNGFTYVWSPAGGSTTPYPATPVKPTNWYSGGTGIQWQLPLENGSMDVPQIRLTPVANRYYYGSIRPTNFVTTLPSSSGTLSVYLSFTMWLQNFDLNATTLNQSFYGSPWYDVVVTNVDGLRQNLGKAVLETFTYNGSPALRMSSRYEVDPLTPVSALRFETYGGSDAANGWGFYNTLKAPSTSVLQWYTTVPSFRVLVSETSADADALEGIADQLAQQNQMINAYYGDVMAVLNQIYTRTGELKTAQEVANSYLLQIFNKLTELDNVTDQVHALLSTYLHYLEELAGTSEDILVQLTAFHTDFLSKLDLLIATVGQESDDIQAKMDAIYEQLIAYLDAQFKGAVPDGVDQVTGDLNSAMNQQEQQEVHWQETMASGFESLDLGGFTLGTTVLNGSMWVSSWMTQIFNAAGDFKMVFMLPMYLGIVMLLVGMISRSAGRGSSKRSSGGSAPRYKGGPGTSNSSRGYHPPSGGTY